MMSILADYGAYDLIDATYPEKSALSNNLIQDQTTRYLEVASDTSYYGAAKAGAQAVLTHGNIDAFLAEIWPIINFVTITITHLFSNIHYRRLLLEEIDWKGTYYINESTIDLMEQFREAANHRLANMDRLEAKMIDLFELFGIRYEDTNEGTSCFVLDNQNG
jgi:hypothetical protein